MSIVGVTASYALYACPYACRAFFTIPAAALNKTTGVQEIPLISKLLNLKPLQFHLAQGA